MAKMGWIVYATDTPTVISAVLRPNVSRNVTKPGSIHVRELDWTVEPEKFVWDDEQVIASPSLPTRSSAGTVPRFDLILTADTVYEPELIQPLLRTLHTLCRQSTPHPPILVCLERRDPTLIDRMLLSAREDWRFQVERIPHRKVAKSLKEDGIEWSKDDWEGVEIWKFTL